MSVFQGADKLETWSRVHLSGPVEICTCGHPTSVHSVGISGSKCEIFRGNCNCNQVHSLLLAREARTFLFPQRCGATGHALTQGAIWSNHGDLNLSYNGRNLLRCYRCKEISYELMPLLMGTHSKRVANHPIEGRMTRLFCAECITRQGLDFEPYLAFLLYYLLNDRRHHPDS